MLLTHADLADRERYLNARSTLPTLLAHRVLPVINENDTVVNDEIKFGDNDTLGALVANLVEADALVILTDQRGLYSADPRKDSSARLIEDAAAGDPALEAMAGDSGSSFGRGGMLAKVFAHAILQNAQASPQPLRALLTQLDRIGGYKEDPLRNKSGLLTLILSQRPEKFLAPGEGEQVEPVIDYHLMRSSLRTGLIEVVDEDLKPKLCRRMLVDPGDEWAVRFAAYQAIQGLVAASGKSTGAVDWFFFGARQGCPEMTEPECAICPVDSACAHRKELFQPVLRTTLY